MAAKGTPSLPTTLDRQTKLAIEKIAETTDVGAGLRGSPDQRYIRIVDLINMGLAKRLSSGAQRLVSGQNLIAGNAPDLSIPPQPQNLQVDGGIGLIFLTWDNARLQYSNHSYTEIWRSETDDLGEATLVGQSSVSFTYQDANVDYTKTYYYWIRFVSTADVKGPYNSPTGTDGQCKQDPAEILALLQNQITESELYSSLNDRIDLIDADGTGLVDRVGDLETVYGDTATAAASASAAIAAQTAAELAAGNADASAISASNSESVATTQATAAASSATLAAGYSSNAGDAATAAATSETNAATSESNAATSASSASSSATSASGSAASAGTSATNAATSETNAGNSATAAAGSASSASTSATNAGNSATSAIAAKVSAESARDDASGYASAASTSASSASTSASDAASSASSASSSASTASTAASDALTYKNDAATSATDAAGYASASAVDYTAVNARLDNAGGTGVTVEQSLSAAGDDLNGLYGQYTLKIDNNGVIAGFGLSSETVNGTTSSYFLVNADTFGIVNNVNSKTITSLTRSGTTATANCTAHGYSVNDKVAISNVYDAGWNGVWTITSTSTNSFTFTVPSTLTTPATTHIFANGRPLSSLTRSSTTATATFLSTPHNIQAGQQIDITGANQSEWNQKWDVTSVTSTTAVFTVPGTNTTPATRSIKVAAQTIPFVVSGGKVVMDGAYMKDGTIGTAAIGTAVITSAKIADAAVGNAQLGNASVDTANIVDLSVTGAKIANATITNAQIANATIVTANIADAQITIAKIADTLQSTSYVSGSAGWKIWKSGDAEFNGIVITRPNVVASGTFNTDGSMRRIFRKESGEWWIPFIYSYPESEAVQSYLQPGSVLEFYIDTGYNNYEDVADLTNGAFSGRAIVTDAYATYFSDPGSNKYYDIPVTCDIAFEVSHYSTGVSTSIPGGRVIIRAIVALPRNIYSTISSIRIDTIDWSLLKVT